jgi:sodium pump decarboxylase gamma subunit
MATTQGIYITVLGMAILFLALLILMLAAMGLEKLFRPKETGEETPAKEENELVAAIAVAIALKLKRQTLSVKRETSEQMLGGWNFLGRQRQLMGARRVKRQRR